MPDRILLLDENTANRIAAGEVVERPASAVKELVENSIDANATQIIVNLEEGGKRRIEVIDNGCGMSPTDAVLALQRHATSKIQTADDLFSIRTLGFRGEAIPSIASVSRFTLITKSPDDSSGVRVLVNGGEMEQVEETGARDGTQISVEDLFFNTPARLKFLKSTSTELMRSVEAVGHLAIAHPNIAIRVRHNTQDVFVTPGAGDHLGALAVVWGRDVARKLIPVRYESPGLTVTGFICTPDLTRPGRSHELFFINGRPIKSRLMSHALEDAMRLFTPESRYPIAALFVDITPDMVDVNVHPTKTEVKFVKDNEVHHAVSQAVKSALNTYGIVPALKPLPDAVIGGEPNHSHVPSQNRFSGPDFDRLARASVEAFMPVIPHEPSTSFPPAEEDDPFAVTTAPLPTKPFSEQLRGFRVLGQAFNTYIVAATDEGLAIVDQHTAHERVLYERLTVKRAEDGNPSQRLSSPFTLSLGAAEAAMLRERLADFANAGWDMEPFGPSAFLVRSVPSYVTKRKYESLLRDMVDELVHQSVARRLIVQRDHVTITNACKMAVKAGDSLAMEEMTGLLAQLADTVNPYMCPHGRPVVVVIPFGEIERRFKR